MKLGVYRVYYHRITEKFDADKGVLVEVSHTSPVMAVVAAEKVDDLLESLPKPELGLTGTMTRNVIVQIDQKHKDVLYNARKG
jgi:hypothetical protein